MLETNTERKKLKTMGHITPLKIFFTFSYSILFKKGFLFSCMLNGVCKINQDAIFTVGEDEN